MVEKRKFISFGCVLQEKKSEFSDDIIYSYDGESWHDNEEAARKEVRQLNEFPHEIF